MGLRFAAALALLCCTMPVLAEYPDDCLGPLEPSAATCPPGLSYKGCCDSARRSVFCQGGKLICLDCAGISPKCGWTPGKEYNCGTDGSPDPSGIFSPVCSFCDPACGVGESCVDGTCTPCQPDCDGKECGFDGCGGSCGICPAGEWCQNDSSCQASTQCPPTTDLKCGASFEATTAGESNLLEGYACTDKDSGGAERAYRFVPPADGMVRFELKAMDGAWVRMYLTHSQCTPMACFASGHELLEVPLEGGKEYFVIVDGDTDNEGAFELSVTCQSTCLPNCTNAECGPDGCFGSCGECTGIAECYEGQCFANDGCTPTYLKGCGGCICEECVCGADSWCCEVAWDEACVNRCDVECEGCGLVDFCGDSTCQSPAEDCSICPEDCPCSDSQICVDATCVCAPQCEDKQCGFDGCGGDCGTCPGGQDVCVQGQCVCQPNCEDRECGSDGCEGTCGTCPDDATCSDGLCLATPDEAPDVTGDTLATDLGPEISEQKPASDTGCCAGGTNGPLAFVLSILLSLLVGWAFTRRRA